MKDKKRLSIICVAVLLLVAVIGMSAYTFAKYVTSASVTSQSATVAKWGFVVSANADDLFGSDYTGTGLATKVEGDGISVNSNNATVAPGTTGSMTFSISGTAEVLAQLTVTATGTDVSLTKGEGEDAQTYNPIKWTLKKGNTVVSAVIDNKNVTFENATLATVLTYLGSIKETITAGQASSHAGDYTLTWAWAFENTESGIDGLSANEADTLLGQAANGTTLEGYTAVTSISNLGLNITVTQAQGTAPATN